MATKKTGPGAAAARRKKTKKRAGAKAAPAARTPLPEAVPPALHGTAGTPHPPRIPLTLADLEPGDHLCCIYETEAEHRAILTPYLRQGLERGEKIIYVVDAHTAETVLGYLRSDGLDPAPFLARGQLAILSRDETYLRGRTFSPAGMIALLRKVTERALAEGYPALRVTGEMTWALRGHPGSKRLIEYEVLLDEFFPGSRCLALCQYDRRRLEPGVLLFVLRTHPYVVVGSDICENHHYLPPADLLSADSSAAELGRRLRGLTEQRRTLHELRVHQAELETQNEELRLAQAELDAAQAKYFDLYDLAPVGYCTISEAGLILEANLTAATLLGVASGALVRQPFSRFIVKEDEDIFYLHRKQLLATAAAQAYELRMARADGAPFWAHLEATAAQDEGGVPVCRVALSDVTERKRAEADLRKLASVVHASSELVNLSTLEGKMIFLNETGSRMLGISPAAVEQFDIMRVIPAHLKEKVETELLPALRRGGTWEGELQYLNIHTGRLTDVHASCYVVRDVATGAPLYLANVSRDITEGKRAAAALRQSETRFGALVAQSPFSIQVLDTTGKTIQVNRAFEDLWGTTFEQTRDFNPLEDGQLDGLGLRPYLQRAFSGEAVECPPVEYTPRTGDVAGLRRVVQAIAFPIKDEAGVVREVTLIHQDITERRRAEGSLRESEQRYRTLVESALDGIVIHVGDRVAFANRAAAAMLGFAEPAAFVGQPLESFVHPDDLAGAADRVRRVLAGEAVAYPVEARYVKRDGTALPVENTGALVTYQGQPAILSVIRDITARKQAEDSLRNSLSLLEATLESTDNGILVVSAEGAVVKVNGRFTQMWHVPGHILASGKDEALLDHAMSQLSDPAAFLAKVKELYSDPQADSEDLLYFKDGRVFERTSKPMLVDGEPAARVWSFLDVSERQRSAEALRKSEARYRRITEGLTDYQYTVRVEEGRAVETLQTAACARVTGYTAEELAADPYLWIQMVTPEDRDRVREHARRILAGEDLPAIEHRIVRKDSAVRWVSDTAILFKDDSGKLLSYDGVISDITERKRAEEALRLSEERHRHLVESSDDWVWETDAHAVITFASARVTDLLGYAPEEVVGRLAYDLMPPEDAERARAAFGLRVAERQAFRGVENTNLHKNGRRVVMESNGVPLFDASGAFRGYRGVDTDITERKLLQAEFLQAQKMESVGRLAGGIAHDFNNLLSVINGYAELAAADRSLSNSQRAQIVAIHRAGQRAATLTQQLLSFSRRQDVAPVVLDINVAIRTAQKMLERLIGEDISLIFAPTEPLGGVEADPGQIEQVVMNLVVNARDAMPEGGMLSIETAGVELDQVAAERASVQPGTYVMLAVSDTGVGMDEATREHIFEPFFTTKGLGKGTGLGLAIVYGIVRQSHGGIRVASIPGQGTTFTIYLPQAEAPVPQDGAPQPAPAVVGGTETILVVEDEDSVRALATDLLESAGYTVLQARDGEEALQVLERHGEQVRLVFSDMVMPGMSGLALAEEIAKTRPALRVLFTSGYDSGSIARGGVPHGATHFIAKPYTVAGLSRKVREVLDWLW